MPNKNKKKRFTIHVKADLLYEARIEADSLKEALEIADGMGHDELWKTPGAIIDSEREITGVFS